MPIQVVTTYEKKDTEGVCPYFQICKDANTDDCNDCSLAETYCKRGKTYASNP